MPESPENIASDEAKKPNIFKTPLLEKEEKVRSVKKSNITKGLMIFIIAFAFLGGYSYTFFFPKLDEYLDFPAKIASAEEDVDEIGTTISSLKDTRNLRKAAYDEKFKEQQDKLDLVLPDELDKRGVIWLMEKFATHLKVNEMGDFEFNSISFGSPIEKEGYIELPFQMSIHSSRENFGRFLGLIERSGDLEAEDGQHIRLMEISNISLNYRGVDNTGKDLGVDFSISMKAFSRKS